MKVKVTYSESHEGKSASVTFENTYKYTTEADRDRKTLWQLAKREVQRQIGLLETE